MRVKVPLLLVILSSLLLLSSDGVNSYIASARATKMQAQVQIGGGRFVSPGRGQSHQATVGFTIQWELDSPAEVAYQDLNLSTDGGATFNVEIAAYLSPSQRQLKWSTLPRNATPRARLQIILHETDGDVTQVVSDDFSLSHEARAVVPDNISASSTAATGSQTATPGNPQHGVSKTGVSSASDITNSSIPTDSEKTKTVEPNFAGTGSCATWNVPNVTLDYNMGNFYATCGSAEFTGEPALAQNPNDPKHFVLLHNRIAPHKNNEPNEGYGYSPKTKVGPLLQAPPYSVAGDPTVEITTDGSVYAVTLGFSSFAVPRPDTILIFRSTDGGLNFGNGVPLPKPAGVQFVDKPVMDVHKNNPNILAVTVNPLGSDGFFTGSAYVVICTSASTLSNFTVVQPLDNNGNPVKPYGTLHPLIDPIAVGSPSYWLFLVYTNDDFSGGSRSQAGMTVFQYQVTGSSLGNGGRPINSLIRTLPGNPPLWTINPNHTAGSAVEKCLRIHDSRFAVNIGPGNISKATIDYCDPNAHRMYLPNHANSNGVSSNLYVTIWQYSGANQSVTNIVTGEQEIYPSEKQKYAACAVTDGHGRIWVTAYIVGNTTDTNRAQMGAIAIHRTSAVPGPIAYRSVRLPIDISNAYNSTTNQGLFLGDYVYTQAAFYTFNGRSRIAYPTFMDGWFDCGKWEYNIGVSGWY